MHITAQDAKSTIEALKKHKFNLVISDYEMPDMNGIKALKTWPEEDKESEDILKTTAIILNTTAPKKDEKDEKDENFKAANILQVVASKLRTKKDFENILD